MTLGNRISRLRREQKLSQEAIADALQVSRQAVSKWENDLSSPDTQNLIQLAQLLEVDVEYLATGELTEDLDSDPLPEPFVPPVPMKEKHPGRGKRVLALLLIVALIGNIVLFCLWQHEKNDKSEMLEFCSGAANASRSCFADYVHYGGDGNYWKGVAEFRRFMQAYAVLRDGDHGGEYAWFNILYGHMIYDRACLEPYMEELRCALRLLGEDPLDCNAHDEIHRLNNLIEHGDE